MPLVENSLRVFGWHNVTGTWYYPLRPGIGLRGIERQLRVLRRTANVVPLGPALEALARGRELPPRAVAITFDDGYRDNLEFAVPLLERLHLPASFFLVPGFLSGAVKPWWEVLAWAFLRARCDTVSWEGAELRLTTPASRRRLFESVAERLKSRDRASRDIAVGHLTGLLDPAGTIGDLLLDWDGARQLARRGFAIGSHTMCHTILSQETPEAQLRDLVASRHLLEDGLDCGVELLAYPNGTERDYSAATIGAAQRAGYAHALTTRGGRNGVDTPPYEIRRFVIRPERGAHGLGVVSPAAQQAYGVVKRLRSGSSLSEGFEHSRLSTRDTSPPARRLSPLIAGVREGGSEASDRDDVKVLYILGPSRTGSTLLAQLLGQLNGFFSAGEVRFLWQHLLERRRCGCGRPIADCEVWSAVVGGVLGDCSMDGLHPADIVQWQRKSVRLRHTTRILRQPEWSTAWSPLNGYSKTLERTYKVLARQTRASVLIDASKAAPDAAVLLRVPGVQPYFLHLVRDSRAVIYSERQHKVNPDGGHSQEMPRPTPPLSIAYWIADNMGSEVICHRSQPGHSMFLRYEDYIVNPGRAIEGIVDFLGEERQSPTFIDEQTVMLETNHMIAGNASRFEVGALRLRRDDRWLSNRSNLDRLTTGVTFPLLGRYGYLTQR
jgi:peptidoglycan/xylan/chitin deacetylase (PgdA/CDA1 family)